MCKLQPEGLVKVFKGVKVNTTLETLNLSWNTVDVMSASHLGKSTCSMTFHAHHVTLDMCHTNFVHSHTVSTDYTQLYVMIFWHIFYSKLSM